MKNLLVVVSLSLLAGCGVPDAELEVTDQIRGEPELMEDAQELSSSRVSAWWPLQAGNEWVLQGADTAKTVKITYAANGVAYVTGLHAEGKWVGVAASTPNTLYGWDGDAGRWNVFVRFGYAVTPWTYKQSEGGCQSFAARRVATGQEYATVAGAFSDTRAISFSMQPAANVRCAQPDFSEIVFAAGVGPILVKNGAGEKFALVRAKVGTAVYPKPTATTGGVTVKITTDKATYVNQQNTIRCITTPCPSNELTAEAKVTLTITNTTNEVQSFRFTSGCHTNVELFDASGRVVKNLAIARMCTMALSTVAINPGQSKVYTELVPLVADSGEQLSGTYRVKGSLTASSSSSTAPLYGFSTINVTLQ